MLQGEQTSANMSFIIAETLEIWHILSYNMTRGSNMGTYEHLAMMLGSGIEK